MSASQRIALAMATALAVVPVASAEKLSKESKRWLEEEVAPIIAPSEGKTYKDLKESDRAEFQKIFWARRDPSNDNIAKPENDFKAEYLKLRDEADQKFKVAGRRGSQTDCGRTYILLGAPDETKPTSRGEPQPGVRVPETWTYIDNPSRAVRIQDGSMNVMFDEHCQFPGGKFGEQLTRIAESKIIRPNLEYRFSKDGRLVKLVDMLPKPSPAQLLLKEPRKDFTAGADVQFLKTSDGGTGLVGVVHGSAEGMTVQDFGGKKVVKVVVAAQATTPEGRTAATYEQATMAPVTNGVFMASYRLGLKPGHYQVRVGALDEATKKGSVVETPTDVPDFNTGALSVASLIAVREIEDKAQNDPAEPFAAYLLGTSRLVPFPSTTLSKSDALNIFYQYYDAKLDETTGKASVVSSLMILKGDKPVARAADYPFDLPVGGTIVGPVLLEKYEPGSYTVRLKITDNVAKKDVTKELSFEVK